MRRGRPVPQDTGWVALGSRVSRGGLVATSQKLLDVFVREAQQPGSTAVKRKKSLVDPAPDRATLHLEPLSEILSGEQPLKALAACRGAPLLCRAHASRLWTPTSYRIDLSFMKDERIESDGIAPLRPDIRGPRVVHVQDDGDLRLMARRSTDADLISLDPYAAPGKLLANFSVGATFVVLDFAMVDGSLELVRVDIRGYAAADSDEAAVVEHGDLRLPLRRMRDAALREHRDIARWLLMESEDDLTAPGSGLDSEKALARQSLQSADQHFEAATRARTSAEVKAPITKELCKEFADLYRGIATETKAPPVRAINAEIARQRGLPLTRVNRVIYMARHKYHLLPPTERGIPRA